jgi:hypothetical protein
MAGDPESSSPFFHPVSKAETNPTMNFSVRLKLIPPGQEDEPRESREEKILRIRGQVTKGFYGQQEVMQDVADALLMNPVAFENLNEKKNGEQT